MNPDMLASIEHHRRVIGVYVTAGDLGMPGERQYWLDRERGIVRAYAFMISGAGTYAYESAAIPGGWTAHVVERNGLRFFEYRYLGNAHDVSLLFLRLGDFQTQCLWQQANGCSGFNPSPPGLPYDAYTLGCAGIDDPLCPQDMTMQFVSRADLVAVLEDLIVEVRATSVGFLDATALHFDTLGSVAVDTYSEYWDHYFTALFALTAVTRAQPAVTWPIHVASFRGYTISRESANLDEATSCAKFAAFAQYAPYDAAIVVHPTPDDYRTCPECFLSGGYRYESPISWQRRQYPTRSVEGRGPLATAAGCAGIVDGLPRIVACEQAPAWETTPDRRLRVGDTLCLGVDQATGYVTRPSPICEAGPCEPEPPIFPAESVSVAPCDEPRGEAATFIVLDNGQIRTANARCLTAVDGALVSADCLATQGSGGHVTGDPPADQRWSLGL